MVMQSPFYGKEAVVAQALVIFCTAMPPLGIPLAKEYLGISWLQ